VLANVSGLENEKASLSQTKLGLGKVSRLDVGAEGGGRYPRPGQTAPEVLAFSLCNAG